MIQMIPLGKKNCQVANKNNGFLSIAQLIFSPKEMIIFFDAISNTSRYEGSWNRTANRDSDDISTEHAIKKPGANTDNLFLRITNFPSKVAYKTNQQCHHFPLLP